MGACSHFAVVLLFYRTIVRGMTGFAGHPARQNIANNEAMQSTQSWF